MSLRLAHLSDVHFGAENPAAAEAAVAYTQAAKPDAVIVSGDLTLGGRLDEFKSARAWLSRLPHPLLLTPGNHDTPYWNLLLRSLNPFGRYRRYLAPLSETNLTTPKLAIRTLNTSRGAQPRLDWSKGAINLDAARCAAAELNECKAALKVLVCHHPLVEPKQVAVSGNVHRGEEAAGILASEGVDIILTGHVHNPFALALPHYGGMTYAIGAGTLSLRTRGTPESFSMIEADDNTINVSALGWSGTAFEPLLSWVLPRRPLPLV